MISGFGVSHKGQGLRGEYAERRKKYDRIFRFSFKMEYPRAFKRNIIESPLKHDIIFHLGLPQEYAYSYFPQGLTLTLTLNRTGRSLELENLFASVTQKRLN